MSDVTNVIVNSDGTEIIFEMEDGSKRIIIQPLAINRSYDPVSFALMALSAVVLQAYDRIYSLEQVVKGDGHANN